MHEIRGKDRIELCRSILAPEPLILQSYQSLAIALDRALLCQYPHVTAGYQNENAIAGAD